jgi:mannosyltransferase OCH1-like enzyme
MGTRETVVIPKHIITTWICDPERDRYTDRHRDMFKTCFDSWMRLMPDYQYTIITYGDLVDKQDPWLRARLAEGNFIGASQWARLAYLYEYGGIFLDADVQAIKRFDELLETPFTLGHLGNGQRFANNAVMACHREHPWIHEHMAGIKRADPRHPDFGNHTGPFMVTELLKKRGWSTEDRDEIVEIGREEGSVSVRRSAVFHPYSWNESFGPEVIKHDTIAVHHWASSWKPEAEQTTHAWR